MYRSEGARYDNINYSIDRFKKEKKKEREKINERERETEEKIRKKERKINVRENTRRCMVRIFQILFCPCLSTSRFQSWNYPGP